MLRARSAMQEKKLLIHFLAVGSSLQFTLKDFGLVPLLLIISLTPICGRLSAKPFFPLNLIGLVTRTPRFLGLFPPVGPFAKKRLSEP